MLGCHSSVWLTACGRDSQTRIESDWQAEEKSNWMNAGQDWLDSFGKIMSHSRAATYVCGLAAAASSYRGKNCSGCVKRGQQISYGHQFPAYRYHHNKKNEAKTFWDQNKRQQACRSLTTLLFIHAVFLPGGFAFWKRQLLTLTSLCFFFGYSRPAVDN